MTDHDRRKETWNKSGLAALFGTHSDAAILQEVVASDVDLSPGSSVEDRSSMLTTPTTQSHSKSDGSVAGVTHLNIGQSEFLERLPIDDDVPFDPWDDRTPEEKAAYEAAVDEAAELAQSIPFGPDE